jgi:hypothetical protein
MASSIKWLLALGVGVAGGWAIRSLSDTPEGAGVKLLELGIKTKDRVSSWAAIERERLEDMLAEAQSNVTRESESEAKSGHRGGAHTRNGRVTRRESQSVKPAVRSLDS